MGHGCGAASVSMHMVAPPSKGYCHFLCLLFFFFASKLLFFVLYVCRVSLTKTKVKIN